MEETLLENLMDEGAGYLVFCGPSETKYGVLMIQEKHAKGPSTWLIHIAADPAWGRFHETSQGNRDARQSLHATVHRPMARKTVLTEEIELAKSKAIDPTSPRCVFCEMVKLAEGETGCLVGVIGNSVKYRIGNKYHLFDVSMLRKRMDRANAKDQSRQKFN